MDLLGAVRELRDQGRCSQALKLLEQQAGTTSTAAACLRAEILAQTGRHQQARVLAENLLESCELNSGERSICEYVIATSLIERGEIDNGVRRLQHAAILARRAGNLRQLFWCQLKLFAVLPERAGREAAMPLLAELRLTTTRLADVTFTAALHSYFAEFEAKCGLYEIARRHNNISRRLVPAESNIWLQAFVDNMTFALHLLRSEFDVAQPFGVRAVKLRRGSRCRRDTPRQLRQFG
jgi:hypothetical protein